MRLSRRRSDQQGVCDGKYADQSCPLLADTLETGKIAAAGICIGDRVVYMANDCSRTRQYYILYVDVASFELVYSITVHKARGAQFRLVIISI